MDAEPQLRTLRYSIDCGRLYPGCTMKIVGSFDEVLDECVAHARRAHGAKQDDGQLRSSARSWVRQEAIEWLWPRAESADTPGSSADWPAH